MGDIYVTRYLRDGYRLADAFRPDPKWGTRVFTIHANGLPPHTEEEVVESARLAAPPGYWLQSVTVIGNGERQLFFKPVQGADWPPAAS